MTGGLTALAGAIVLGPRAGKFRRDGTIGAIPGHNLPMTVIGTLILAFGWFGFNAGSTLAGADPRVATIAVNTMLASSAGAFTALVFVWYASASPTSRWSAMASSAAWWQLPAPARSSARRPP